MQPSSRKKFLVALARWNALSDNAFVKEDLLFVMKLPFSPFLMDSMMSSMALSDLAT